MVQHYLKNVVTASIRASRLNNHADLLPKCLLLQFAIEVQFKGALGHHGFLPSMGMQTAGPIWYEVQKPLFPRTRTHGFVSFLTAAAVA